MPAKKPTDLKSVSLGQVKGLESATVIGGSGATESASTASKVAKDDAKLAKDREKGMAGDTSSSKDKRDGAKTAKDMKKVARDAGTL